MQNELVLPMNSLRWLGKESQSATSRYRRVVSPPPWSAVDDRKLLDLVQRYGDSNRWALIGKKLGRLSAHCLDRYSNYLRTRAPQPTKRSASRPIPTSTRTYRMKSVLKTVEPNRIPSDGQHSWRSSETFGLTPLVPTSHLLDSRRVTGAHPIRVVSNNRPYASQLYANENQPPPKRAMLSWSGVPVSRYGPYSGFESSANNGGFLSPQSALRERLFNRASARPIIYYGQSNPTVASTPNYPNSNQQAISVSVLNQLTAASRSSPAERLHISLPRPAQGLVHQESSEVPRAAPEPPVCAIKSVEPVAISLPSESRSPLTSLLYSFQDNQPDEYMQFLSSYPNSNSNSSDEAYLVQTPTKALSSSDRLTFDLASPPCILRHFMTSLCYGRNSQSDSERTPSDKHVSNLEELPPAERPPVCTRLFESMSPPPTSSAEPLVQPNKTPMQPNNPPIQPKKSPTKSRKLPNLSTRLSTEPSKPPAVKRQCGPLSYQGFVPDDSDCLAVLTAKATVWNHFYDPPKPTIASTKRHVLPRTLPISRPSKSGSGLPQRKSKKISQQRKLPCRSLTNSRRHSHDRPQPLPLSSLPVPPRQQPHLSLRRIVQVGCEDQWRCFALGLSKSHQQATQAAINFLNDLNLPSGSSTSRKPPGHAKFSKSKQRANRL